MLIKLIRLTIELWKYRLQKPHTKHNRCDVILKADDLADCNKKVLKLDKIINKENICISWGIIGKSLENPSLKDLSFLKNKKQCTNYHFFNHGYLHLGGEEYEFCNRSVNEQYNFLKQTQEIVKNKTGIILDTFGAPCNHIDDNTAKALEKFSEIKNWYYGLNSSKRIFHRYIEIEDGVGNPDFFQFKKQWHNLTPKPQILEMQ